MRGGLLLDSTAAEVSSETDLESGQIYGLLWYEAMLGAKKKLDADSSSLITIEVLAAT